MLLPVFPLLLMLSLWLCTRLCLLLQLYRGAAALVVGSDVAAAADVAAATATGTAAFRGMYQLTHALQLVREEPHLHQRHQ